jgi:hypothetical protein
VTEGRAAPQVADEANTPLTLQGPGDEVVAQEHCIAQSGPAGVGTTGPVSISVDDKVRCRGAAKKQVVIEGALEVPKDALRGREMVLTRGACGDTPARSRRKCRAW